MRHEFTCWACNSHKFYTDANDDFIPIRYCLNCDRDNTPVPQTIDVELVNRNEQTSIAEIAMNYLVGRKMVLTGHIVQIEKVWQTQDSRMCLTVALEGGIVRHLYLPTKIELLPLEVQNAEQD